MADDLKLQTAAFGLVVSDMAATVAFYRRLGLAFPEGSEQQPHVESEFGGVRLLFDTEDTIRTFDDSWKAPSGSTRHALAFLLESPAAVDAAYAQLTAAGAEGHLEPWDAVWGQRYAVLHDPDGTSIDLFAASS